MLVAAALVRTLPRAKLKNMALIWAARLQQLATSKELFSCPALSVSLCLKGLCETHTLYQKWKDLETDLQ